MESKKILNMLTDSDILDFIKECEEDLTKPDNELRSYVLYKIIDLLKEDMSDYDKEIFAKKLNCHCPICNFQKRDEEYSILCTLIDDLKKETNELCGYKDYEKFFVQKILPIKHKLFAKTFEKLQPDKVWERFYCRADKNVAWKDVAEALKKNPRTLVLDLSYMNEYLRYDKDIHDYDYLMDGNIPVGNY